MAPLLRAPEPTKVPLPPVPYPCPMVSRYKPGKAEFLPLVPSRALGGVFENSPSEEHLGNPEFTVQRFNSVPYAKPSPVRRKLKS